LIELTKLVFSQFISVSVDKNKHTRRNFLRAGFAGLGVGIVALWGGMVFRQKEIGIVKSITVPYNPNKEVSFLDEFIIINSDGITNVFSSRCTHLGCKINHLQNSELQCPCHGSSFMLDGSVVKGPALRALDKLEFEIGETRDRITVKV